ncbi:MAG: Omp28-related outer membrane protein [Bacteroidales bacterium]
MKKLLLFISGLLFTSGLFAQVYVSTVPENKKALLEEFTGTGCPNCPGGHTMAANLLTANPGNVFVIAYHPTNSNYTATDPMKNVFGNAFYTNPFISPTNRYMPSAMINRRVWGGVERIQGVSNWTSDVATIMAEASPLNVGLSSTYDGVTHVLDVTLEVYYTADVTEALTVYTVLTEDGIIAAQSGGTSPYTHNHVFRAALPQPSPAQWGEPVTGATTSGSLTTINYSFDNTTTNFDMTKCELVVFVRNAVTEEILSGNAAAVGMATGTQLIDRKGNTSASIYPNPVTTNSTVSFTIEKPCTVSYRITNITGQILSDKGLGYYTSGSHSFMPDTESLSKGLYYLTINTSGSEPITLKIAK